MKLRKKSKKTQGTSKKGTDGQPHTGVTRGERTHKRLLNKMNLTQNTENKNGIM